MRVSVIIANRNDTAMLTVTVRSAIEEFVPLSNDGEVVIVDNSDKEIWDCRNAILPTGYMTGPKPKIKMFRQDYPCLFTARETAIKESSSKYIVCVDSHCLFGHRVIADLVEFMERNEHRKIGFAHAPVNWFTHHEDRSRHNMAKVFGTWGGLYTHERKISWKGMPWICKRDWFLNELQGYGALSQHRLAWGGGDMHLGLKSWVLGYENWAVPARPVIHLGPFPAIARKFHKYRVYSHSGTHFPWLGFLVSLRALGADYMFERKDFIAFMEDRNKVNILKHLELAKKLANDERRRLEKDKINEVEFLENSEPWET